MDNNTNYVINLPLLSPFALEVGEALPEKTVRDILIADGAHYMVMAPVLIPTEPYYSWATIFCSGDWEESALFMEEHGERFTELYLVSTDKNMKILDETGLGNILRSIGISNDNGKP